MPEKIIMSFNPTRFAYLRYHALSIALISLRILSFLNLPNISYIQNYRNYLLALPAMGILIIVLAEVIRKQDQYVLTDLRIIEKSGLFSVKETSIPWNKIADYSLTQDFLERFAGYGTLIIESTGGSEKPDIVLKNCADIKRIKDIIDKYHLR